MIGNVGAYAAHALSKIDRNTKARGVTVGVVDTGFDVNHPDLEEAFDWRGVANRATGNPIGLNLRYKYESKKVLPEENVRVPPKEKIGDRGISHGTHVAGIIGARDNDKGFIGVAPESTILPIHVVPVGPSTGRREFRADVGPDHVSFKLNTKLFVEFTIFAAANGAFVLNNSSAYGWRPRVVEIDLKGRGKGYILQPRVVKDGYANFTSHFGRTSVIESIKNANKDPKKGMIFVFAAGNNGWNSETGMVPVYSQKFTGDDINKYRNAGERDRPKYIRANATEIARTGTPANLPTPISAAFLGNPELNGLWLAVVAVNRENIIAYFSNGCGEAKDYCLAAPGVKVASTVHSRENRRIKRYKIPSAGGPDFAYDAYSGTSMAAPVVSGAAAVVKSASPTLTARQVVDILLRTATDLGKPGIDNVYGRGLLNLEKALNPIGSVTAASARGNAMPDAFARDTRLSFSSAFGNTASNKRLLFGAFDEYKRVFNYRAPMLEKRLDGPSLDNVLALNSSLNNVMQDAVVPPKDGNSVGFQRSSNPISPLGDGMMVTFKGDFGGIQGHLDVAHSAHRKSSTLSPASAFISDKTSSGFVNKNAPVSALLTSVLGYLAPEMRDMVGGATRLKLAHNLSAGLFFNQGLVDGSSARTEKYPVQDFGTEMILQGEQRHLRLRFGQINERDHFLGSKPEGGYALHSATKSRYLRFDAQTKISPRIGVGVDVVHLRSDIDFKHDEFVRDMKLRSQAVGAHVSVTDTIEVGDRLTLQVFQPLTVTKGQLHQTSVNGYTAAGGYRPADHHIDLSVRKRHTATQLVYQRPIMPGVSAFAAAAHHRHWGNMAYQNNNLMMAGVSIKY
ncbi:S8 family serine peptidase [SAR116 cluster bacterium]|nr:S8 family serine peptidase [SAR116 cluster bacterium]